MKPYRSRSWLAFIRSLPCCVCGIGRGVQAAHTGTRGLSQRADDRTAIPLCVAHHDRRKPYSIHSLGPMKFQARYGIDIRAIVGELNDKPLIYPEGNAYLGRYRGEVYELCPRGAGLGSEIRKMAGIRHEVLRESFSKREVA